jgi:hypothetical protein
MNLTGYRRISEVIKTIKLNKDGTILSSKNSYILDNGKPYIGVGSKIIRNYY